MTATEEFEDYFEGIDLPEGLIDLNMRERITSVQIFIENHFITVKSARNYQIAAPFRDRLLNN